MAASNKDGRRRRRILEGGQDRLALITGRKQQISADVSNGPDSSLSPQSTTLVVVSGLRNDLIFDPPQSPSSAFQNEVEKHSDTTYFTRDQVPKFPESDPLTGQSNKEPFTRKPEPVPEPSRASTTEHNRGESSTQVPKALVIVAELAQRILISHISAQQVASAVAETENDRMLCAIVMSILVVLASAGFPILSSFLFRWIILFRPLILLIFANLGLIGRRLIPESQKNLARGAKDESKPALGDGYAWAEEAGRALELGLILQSVMSALFMSCSVFAAIVVYGLSLFG